MRVCVLADLLLAFNRGDISGYRQLFASQAPSEAALKSAETFLNEKIQIMALIEMVSGGIQTQAGQENGRGGAK
jgi:hypothetical protein